MTWQTRISTPISYEALRKRQVRDQEGKNLVGRAPATSVTWRTSGVPSIPECSQRKAVTTLRHLYPKNQRTSAHMRAEASFVSFSPPRAFLSRFLIGEKAEPLQKHAGSYSSRCAFARLCVYAHAQGRGGTQRPGGGGFRPSNMAPTMLVLLVPPLPVARGLLWNCWKQLQRKLLQSRPGFPSPPWGT